MKSPDSYNLNEILEYKEVSSLVWKWLSDVLSKFEEVIPNCDVPKIIEEANNCISTLNTTTALSDQHILSHFIDWELYQDFIDWQSYKVTDLLDFCNFYSTLQSLSKAILEVENELLD